MRARENFNVASSFEKLWNRRCIVFLVKNTLKQCFFSTNNLPKKYGAYAVNTDASD